MKIVGMLLVVIFTACLGVLINRYKVKEIKEIENANYLLLKVKNMLENGSVNTDKIHKSIILNERFKSFNDGWNNQYLSDKDNEYLYEVYNCIGKSDATSQLVVISNSISYFSDRKKDIKSNYEAHKRLNLIFSISMGILFDVLVM